MSHDTITKIEQIQQHATDEVKQKVRSGKMSVWHGYMYMDEKPAALSWDTLQQYLDKMEIDSVMQAGDPGEGYGRLRRIKE